ncbi:MFS transporter [Pseudomonas fluorescens]|uniref:MFS transporter n=1 Tax=Pseudomonas fluorescens TaxID=294 RepID=UPI001906BCF8|nr:MFS transporter [Pseudomonas fluorescens]MBD8094586.1 MFS transporter [Pseudomonas fluorescens]MBD8720503.1 MFS transporter [Pseudomonas fluorescens]
MSTVTVIEKQIIQKIFIRLLPLLICLYIISYLDRVNVGFAALTMNADIGLSAAVYGWGAGLFFIGYCIFEIPSNLIMAKVGARRWIARILFTWGIIATCMALVQGPKSFLIMRFLLGVAEAGFFPAVILYLTFWFPARYRARIISIFMLSIPISLAIGAPVSTALLQLDGWMGLKGWQWLFIIEGIPGILLVGVVLKYLPDSPEQATWLTEEERRWLAAELEEDAKVHSPELDRRSIIVGVFCNPSIVALCCIYFCATAANVGLSMFLPQIIRQQGFTGMDIGYITAIPYIVGCVGMVSIGFLSDKFNKRKVFLIAALLLIAAGLGIAGWLTGSSLAIIAMCVATIGIMGCKGPFWPLPALYLSGTSAAAGIALINSIGNLGGFFGPGIIGITKEITGTFESGLYVLSGLAIFAAFITLIFISDRGKAKILS